MLFQIIKDDLLLLLIHEWIDYEELVNLDSAFCHRDLRSRYLAMTKNFSMVITITSNNLDLFMNWKTQRKIRVKTLRIKIIDKQKFVTPSIPELTSILIQSAIENENFFGQNVVDVHLNEFLQRLPSLEYAMFQGESRQDQNIHIHTTSETPCTTELKTFPHLRELHFDACEFRDTSDILGDWLGPSLPVLQKFSIVECLYIFSNDFIPKLLSKLSGTLQSLRFHNTQYDFEEHFLSDLSNQLELLQEPSFSSELNLQGPLTNIQELEICGYWHITELKDFATLLKVCSSVHTLSLFRMNVDYEQRFDYVAALVHQQILRNKPQLERLTMNIMLRDDTYFAELEEDMEEQGGLERHGRQDPYISRRQMITFESIHGLTNLKALHFVKFSNITDEILVAIAQNCKKLEEIRFTMLSVITEDGIIHFCEQFAGNRRQVTTISIQECPNITTSKVCLAILNTFPCLVNFYYDPQYVTDMIEQEKMTKATQVFQAQQRKRKEL